MQGFWGGRIQTQLTVFVREIRPKCPDEQVKRTLKSLSYIGDYTTCTSLHYSNTGKKRRVVGMLTSGHLSMENMNVEWWFSRQKLVKSEPEKSEAEKEEEDFKDMEGSNIHVCLQLSSGYFFRHYSWQVVI